MKKRSFVLPFIALSAGIVFTGCPKNKNTAPLADTEFASATEVAWATFVVTDIEMMCAFVGVGEREDLFYTHREGTAEINWIDATHSVADNRISVNFHETPCVDGRMRKGEVRLYYMAEPLSPNADYYHEFGFNGHLTLHDYRVDGWLITVDQHAVLRNTLVSNSWDPAKTTLQWTLEGKFNFEHPTDPSRNMTWEGKITKELLNTADTRVFSPTTMPYITWPLASAGYYGSVSGLAPGNVPYSMTIRKDEMLVRDFTCSPDLLGVAVDGNDLQPRKSEFHPFSKGISTFEIADKYPRRVYFGNEANRALPAQCDNSGQIMIKGILYPINFRE